MPIMNTKVPCLPLTHLAQGLRGVQEKQVEARDQIAAGRAQTLFDARRHPRFKIEVDITIHSRTCGVLTGRTVDISATGIGAILRIEVPIGELVELQFVLPFGAVTIYAVARQKNAFRYGFHFAESNSVHRAIRETCRHLAVKGALRKEV
jgi:PilZ domain